MNGTYKINKSSIMFSVIVILILVIIIQYITYESKVNSLNVKFNDNYENLKSESEVARNKYSKIIIQLDRSSPKPINVYDKKSRDIILNTLNVSASYIYTTFTAKNMISDETNELIFTLWVSLYSPPLTLIKEFKECQYSGDPRITLQKYIDTISLLIHMQDMDDANLVKNSNKSIDNLKMMITEYKK